MENMQSNTASPRLAEETSSDPQLLLRLIDCVRLTNASEVTVVVVIENSGRIEAREVKVQATMTSLSDYTVESWRCPVRLVGRLSPGDTQTLEFTISPKDIRSRYVDVTFVVFCWDPSGETSERFTLKVPMTREKAYDTQIRNPYIPGNPLDPRHSANMFVGRRELIRYIVDNLVGKFQQNVLVLHGQRRIGKTSLLLQLRYDILKPPLYPVFVDIQGLVDVGTYLFLHRLAKAIAESLNEFGRFIEIPTRQTILEGGYGAFEEFLDRVAGKLRGGYLVVLLDEFEELEKRVQDRKIDHDIFSFMRSLMQHRHWMIFVFTGTHRIEELSKEYFSIFFNTAIHSEISFLSESEAEALIREPLATFVAYEDRAVRRIKEVTSYHPYFIQLICYHLIDHINREGRSEISSQDVNDVMREITESGVGHLDYLWSASSPQEQSILCGIAELQRTLPRVRSFPYVEILRAVESMGEKMASSELSRAIESLTSRDLVRHDPTSHTFGITFELLSRWIREKHPRAVK